VTVDELSQIALTDPQLKANPYVLFARLRDEAPVCRARGMTQSFWLVTRYDDVAFVLKSDLLASDRRNVPIPSNSLLNQIILRLYRPLLRNMLTSDEPDHGRLRGLVQKAFTPRRIENLRSRMETLTHRLLDRVAQRREWDMVADYGLPLPVTIIAEMLGSPSGTATASIAGRTC
jgi:cytochrome P450